MIMIEEEPMDYLEKAKGMLLLNSFSYEFVRRYRALLDKGQLYGPFVTINETNNVIDSFHS